MKVRKFSIDWETFYHVKGFGHGFTIFEDTPARYIPITVDGYPVSLPACPTLAEAVALALSHCL